MAAGRKIVIEAGTELTIKAGGGFIKLDPSGVYVGGAKVKLNSGGSPGKGTEAKPLLPVLSTNVDEISSFRRENVQSMGVVGSIVPGLADPVPATVTSEEEICRAVMASKNSKKVQEGLAKAMELTRSNGVEYSGWILEDGPGEYSVGTLKKGESMAVIPDPKPANAIGNFHTHTSSSARPSSNDQYFASSAKSKCIFYMIVSAYGEYHYIDGNGGEVFCDN